MGDWIALAEQLAENILEPGFGAAEAFARAYRAGADLAGVRGLVGAALALTEGRALHAACAYADPCPDSATLVTWTENLEAHVVVLLKRCTDLGRAARNERSAAVHARTKALSAAMTAGSASDTPEQRQAAEAAQAEARAIAEQAAVAIADCEAALEVLGQADCKLRYARDLLRAVPAELAEVYEAPIGLVSRGGKMPLSGDFIVPAGTTTAETAA